MVAAYTSIPESSSGDPWTAADHNLYIRDNFAVGVPGAFTAKGDLYFGAGADTGEVLPVGVTGSYLGVSSTSTNGAEWRPFGTTYARYTMGDNRPLPRATQTIMNFSNKEYDTDNAVTTGATWAYTVPAGKGGYFAVCCGLAFTFTDTGTGVWGERNYFDAWARVDSSALNGAIIDKFICQATTATGLPLVGINGMAIVQASSGQTIDILAYCGVAGVDNAYSVGPEYCYVAIARLGSTST